MDKTIKVKKNSQEGRKYLEICLEKFLSREEFRYGVEIPLEVDNWWTPDSRHCNFCEDEDLLYCLDTKSQTRVDFACDTEEDGPDCYKNIQGAYLITPKGKKLVRRVRAKYRQDPLYKRISFDYHFTSKYQLLNLKMPRCRERDIELI